MRFRSYLVTITVSCFLWITSLAFSPAAMAVVQINLSDLAYHQCPAELAAGTVTSGGGSRAANCFLITGKAENKSGKPVVNADIFGRIYDANGNRIMQNRTRLGSIEQVPPGVSDFELRITVPTSQATPLQLEQFKASGFTGKVRR
ncbi:FxLYD domain-containing protein [Lyngbya aestuarii]|uniref:FxLYD domain-containing protein n=1 Tax=Lyngbya aestuarii TaxID=118322 RepID=UPI00403DA086